MAVVKRGKDSKGLKEGYATYTTPELARENKFIRRKLEGFQDTKHENCKKIVEHRDNFKNASVMYSNLRPCELEGLKDLWLNVGDISPSQEFKKWIKSARQQWISDYLRSQKSGIATLKRPLCFCFKVRDKRQDLQIGLNIEIFSKYLNKTVYKCTTNSIGDVRTSSLFYFFAPYTIRWEDKESDEYTAKEIHDMNYFNVDANYNIIAGPSVFDSLDLLSFNQPEKLHLIPHDDPEYIWEEMTDTVQNAAAYGWPSECDPNRGFCDYNYLALEHTSDNCNKVSHVFFFKEDDKYYFGEKTELFNFKGGAPDMPEEYQYIRKVINLSTGISILVNDRPRKYDEGMLYTENGLWGVVKEEVPEYGFHYADPWSFFKSTVREEGGLWKVTISGPPKVWIYPSICELFGHTHNYYKNKGIYWLPAFQSANKTEYIPKPDLTILSKAWSAVGEMLFLLSDKSIYYTGIFIDDVTLVDWPGGPSSESIAEITGKYPLYASEEGTAY